MHDDDITHDITITTDADLAPEVDELARRLHAWLSLGELPPEG